VVVATVESCTDLPLAGSFSNASIWLQEGPPHRQLFGQLQRKHTEAGADGPFDVIVVGGGIVGVTTAFLLKKSGKKVALVEGRRLGCGVTGFSTSKLTSQQQLIYTRLISKYDEQTARLYADMQETAITQVEEISRALKIDCDFQRKSHVTWTSDESKVSEVEQEVEEAKKLGLPAELVYAESLELPASIGVKAAVRFRNQGEFNVYKFVIGLAKHVDGDGCKVFEHSLVTDVSGVIGTHTITCTTGASLQADRIVLATHLPMMDRSAHFMLLPPSKSHVIAVRLRQCDQTTDHAHVVGAGHLRDMYINADSEKRSLRTTQNGSVLVVSGESFETGDETDVKGRYQALEQWAHKHFEVEANLTRWSAMDYYSSAILPYIGYLYRGSDTIYTATGFSKWGLTNGVASAMIIRDLVTGVSNPYAAMVDARRWDLAKGAAGLALEGWHATKHMISDKIKARFAPDISTLKPGEGAVVKAAGEIVGAYHDKNGDYHLVTPVCTHLGCNVVFNQTDRTWDCPCHGSQFAIDGTVIHGPACKNLCKRDDLKW
jgi:glycine/D-amino acid oxidase-like deaminating enzyme/nitrite reductase/ring-hydroxylating ferredoxin subunit